MARALDDFIGKIVVVLVIYEVPLESSPAFRSLCAALKVFDRSSAIFVYDNSSKSQLFCEKNWCSIVYVHDPANGGVSKAYNKAYEYARSVGKEWLLFADQDTLFPEDFFVKLSEAVHGNPGNQVFVPVMNDERGIVSPFRFTLGRGVRVKSVVPGNLTLKKWHFINSGLLIATDLFGRCGGYDERFALDFSDLSFHKRLIGLATDMYLVDICCAHSLSANQLMAEGDMLERFYIYSHSSRIFSTAYHNYFILVMLLLRSVKLSLRYSSLRFIRAAWRYVFSVHTRSLPWYEA